MGCTFAFRNKRMTVIFGIPQNILQYSRYITLSMYMCPECCVSLKHLKQIEVHDVHK